MTRHSKTARLRFTATVSAAVVIACVIPSAASADERADGRRTETSSGLRLGLGTGLALPRGSAFLGSGELAENMTGIVPLRIDVGYRFGHVYVGGVARLGAVLPKDCPADERCSGSDVRLGIMAAWHFLPLASIDPWVGVGAGYEILSLQRESRRRSVDFTARGFELVDFQGGVDVRPLPGLRVGPIVTGSVGQFDSVSINGVSTRDFKPGFHSWFTFGARASYDF